VLNNGGARAIAAHVIDPIAKALLAMRISPDAVTLAGTVGVVLAALLLFPNGNFLAGTLIIIALVFADLLDGTMARMSGRSGPWGAFLDSTLDRIADGAILLGVVLYAVTQGDRMLATAAGLALVGGQLVSYAKARAESLGVACNVGLAERGERLIIALATTLLAGLGVAAALPIGMWVLAAASWFTVGQRMLHVRKQFQAGEQ